MSDVIQEVQREGINYQHVLCYHPTTNQFVLELRSLPYKPDLNDINAAGLIYDFLCELVQQAPNGEWVALNQIYEKMAKCEFANKIEYEFDWRAGVWNYIQNREKAGVFEIDSMMFPDSVAVRIHKDSFDTIKLVFDRNHIGRPYRNIEQNIILTDKLDVDKYYSVHTKPRDRIQPGKLSYDFYAALVRLYKKKGSEWISYQDFLRSLRHNSSNYRDDWHETVTAFIKVLILDKIAEYRGVDESDSEIRIIKPEVLNIVKQNLVNLKNHMQCTE